MTDAHRRKISEALQGENDSVAQAVAARFISQLSNGSLLSREPGIGDRGSGRRQTPVLEPHSLDPDLLNEGFVHVGGALSLAVLVDEPGVFADDLDWLRRMLHARGVQLDPPMIDLLLRSYLDACSSSLEAEEIKVLDDLIGRAKARLT